MASRRASPMISGFRAQTALVSDGLASARRAGAGNGQHVERMVVGSSSRTSRRRAMARHTGRHSTPGWTRRDALNTLRRCNRRGCVPLADAEVAEPHAFVQFPLIRKCGSECGSNSAKAAPYSCWLQGGDAPYSSTASTYVERQSGVDDFATGAALVVEKRPGRPGGLGLRFRPAAASPGERVRQPDKKVENGGTLSELCKRGQTAVDFRRFDHSVDLSCGQTASSCSAR